MLTLESFERATEIVREVTQQTKLISSSYFSDILAPGNGLRLSVCELGKDEPFLTSGEEPRAGALSVPCRYVHTGVETLDLADAEAAVALALAYLKAEA